MHLISRMALTSILAAIAAFCCYGFLATFEPPGFLVFRWLYGAVAVGCIIAIAAVWLGKFTSVVHPEK